MLGTMLILEIELGSFKPIVERIPMELGDKFIESADAIG